MTEAPCRVFITDLGTVLAVGGLFASYGWLLIVFAAVSAVTVWLPPRLLRLAIRFLGHLVSEPVVKPLLVVRSIAFAIPTPFFFLRAGTLISAPALVAGPGW
jgi:hypothetical protein